MPEQSSGDAYKYTIDDIQMRIKGAKEPFIIKTKMVKSLIILKDFDGRTAPIIKLTTGIEKPIILDLLKNVDNVIVNIALYKYKVEVDKGDPYKIRVFKKDFRLIHDSVLDPNVVTKMKDLGINNTNEDKLDTSADLDFYLIDESALSRKQTEKSYIIKSPTINDMVFRFLSDRGYTNVLYTPSPYSCEAQTVIPTGDIETNLGYINEMYGIYDSRYIFFDDVDTTYLIDTKFLGKTCRPLENNIVNMYLSTHDDQAKIVSSCINDTKSKTYIVNLQYTPEFIESSYWSRYLDKGHLHITNDRGSYTTYGDGTLAHMYCNNNHTPNQKYHSVSESEISMDVAMNDIDIDLLTPNKKYNLLPDISYVNIFDIKGSYRLSSTVITLIMTSSDIFDASAMSTFKKQP
jgi:hypothetical protein